MGYVDTVESEWKIFVISDAYRWTLLVTLLMVIHYFVLVMIASKPRKTLFNKDWMEEKFGEEHRQALNGASIQAGGYPDHGSGRYTMELGYKGWMEFNKAQRIHYNYLESISQILCMMLICGLQFPIVTATIGAVYLAARLWFQIGYMVLGPRGRMYAVPFVMLTQFGFPVFTMVSLGYLASKGSSTIAEAEIVAQEMLKAD
uniref:MAPEG family protein n=1 Tax=Strombidium inclinatum TaxID=197538 RepID=A0A7S3IPL8_9SPIT|mmetsp:Transcript_32384/g.49554  ORF Transcript_32384/g.49554 Transcript_32384/m.49554 type:complete len:202 (+) Transcript_32384:35-640(+)|eukprot:CAMPEP_0170491092 /NCGR_PEP_ID=MMETSP0208-20121228/10365_1 /TAXON_ID=197538 /ORGANISM="Strombidium inclinatum, Strain S3" /LENGTH=201 /DNA_ID=CAMNT_0010766607 /DNA_START=11 /DNA_END=616 /DNA_ORIENTATION=+